MQFKKFEQFSTKGEYSQLNEIRKNSTSVFESWERSKANKAQSSIWTDGDHIYSYGTCLVARAEKGDTVVLNVTKYSVTTTNHQNGIRYFLTNDTDYKVVEVTGMPMGVSAYSLLAAADLEEKDPEAPHSSDVKVTTSNANVEEEEPFEVPEEPSRGVSRFPIPNSIKEPH